MRFKLWREGQNKGVSRITKDGLPWVKINSSNNGERVLAELVSRLNQGDFHYALDDHEVQGVEGCHEIYATHCGGVQGPVDGQG